MDRAFQLLTHISENERISQRQLAKILNVSLGTVNGLIQQMLQRGCITLDSSNPKQVKYFLTPEGYKEKALMNHEVIVKSYHMISKAKSHIRNIILRQVSQGINSFFLFGEEDEVYKLTKMCLFELKRDYPIQFNHLADISQVQSKEAYCVLYWNFDQSFENGTNSVNIMFN